MSVLLDRYMNQLSVPDLCQILILLTHFHTFIYVFALRTCIASVLFFYYGLVLSLLIQTLDIDTLDPIVGHITVDHHLVNMNNMLSFLENL